MFDGERLLENGHRGCLIDHRPLLPGPLSARPQALRRRHRAQSLIHQPHRYADGPGQPSSPLPRLHRRRPLTPTQRPRKPHDDLDRLILLHHRQQRGNLPRPALDRHHRVRQDSISIAGGDPDPRIPPVNPEPHASPEAGHVAVRACRAISLRTAGPGPTGRPSKRCSESADRVGLADPRDSRSLGFDGRPFGPEPSVRLFPLSRAAAPSAGTAIGRAAVQMPVPPRVSARSAGASGRVRAREAGGQCRGRQNLRCSNPDDRPLMPKKQTHPPRFGAPCRAPQPTEEPPRGRDRSTRPPEADSRGGNGGIRTAARDRWRAPRT